MTLFRILSSDWLKTKRTAVRLILVVGPVALALVMLWYCGNRERTPDLQFKMYEAFFQITTGLLPFAAGLLAGLMGAQEEHAGHFNGILGQTTPRVKIFIGKLLMLVLMAAAALFASTFILLLGMDRFLHIDEVQVGWFAMGAFLGIVGALFLFELHLFLSFAFGLGTSVATGGAGFLIALLVGTTTVGDRIWPYVPWAWPVRLALGPEVYMPGIQLPDSIIPADYFSQQLVTGLVPALAGFIVIAVCGTIWFNRWEGRRTYE